MNDTDPTLTPYCGICGSGPEDEHWRACPHFKREDDKEEVQTCES